MDRLLAWADAYGESLDTDTNVLGANHAPVSLVNMDSTTATAVIVIISIASLTAIGGFYFLRKRKEQ